MPELKRSEGEDDLPCFRCGVCCRKFQVRLSLEEARETASRLGVRWEEWLDRYADPRWPGTASFLLRHGDGGCVFLRQAEGNRVASCFIHSFRPSSCREWMPGLDQVECREGLSQYWGLGVNSAGKLAGPVEKLREFHSFLKMQGVPSPPWGG